MMKQSRLKCTDLQQILQVYSTFDIFNALYSTITCLNFSTDEEQLSYLTTSHIVRQDLATARMVTVPVQSYPVAILFSDNRKLLPMITSSKSMLSITVSR